MVSESHMFFLVTFKWNSNMIFRLILEKSMSSLILLIPSIMVPIQRNTMPIDVPSNPSSIMVALGTIWSTDRELYDYVELISAPQIVYLKSILVRDWSCRVRDSKKMQTWMI